MMSYSFQSIRDLVRANCISTLLTVQPSIFNMLVRATVHLR